MSGSDNTSRRGILALAGVCGLCCLTLAAISGGAVVTGGAAAGATAAGGAVGGIGGILVTGLATALPIFVIGLVIRYRARRS